MTHHSETPCVFCRVPARRHVLSDLLATDIDCRQCGRYRISERAEETMIRLDTLSNGAWVHVIAHANACGNRLMIPGGQRMPLEDNESGLQRRAS